ncbi:hypothetical protein MPSEU_000513700 [Mayamaea pseudoterrestris]|nr:hypothetical protein MPSEU_000513700 [Mayamaea pseudoterrestris]
MERDAEKSDHFPNMLDPWESGNGGGYTPLSELAADATVMMSAGPEMEGAFYADLSAFAYVEVNGERDNEIKETKEDDLDFRGMADRALRALDDEYRLTVRGAADRLNELQSAEPLPPIRLLSDDFGSSFFRANFYDIPVEGAGAATATTAGSLPEIDAEAVRRAIGSISIKDTKLSQNYAKWESQQRVKLAIAPQSHPLISRQQLFTFRRQSTNAINATSVLSRAATIAEALIKLDLLRGQDYLQIDLLGCDYAECSTQERVRQLFAPLIRWLSDFGMKCPKVLQLHLIGPNVPMTAPRYMELPSSGRLEKVQLYCQHSVYEERVLSDKSAQLLFAFHAGIWGYNEWRPTLRYLARLRQKVYFVVTAYTLEEAEDDYEVIQDEVSLVWQLPKEDLVGSACIWTPVANAFASKQDRATTTAPPGRQYRDNAAWQAWCL